MRPMQAPAPQEVVVSVQAASRVAGLPLVLARADMCPSSSPVHKAQQLVLVPIGAPLGEGGLTFAPVLYLAKVQS